PKQVARSEDDERSRYHLQHQGELFAERFDQNPRRNIGDNHHRNDPAKNQTEEARINDIGITRDIKEVEITVDKSLGAHDPETDRRQIQHDGIMNGDAETDRHQIEENMQDRKSTRLNSSHRTISYA